MQCLHQGLVCHTVGRATPADLMLLVGRLSSRVGAFKGRHEEHAGNAEAQ
jgi:hypothetical protein